MKHPSRITRSLFVAALFGAGAAMAQSGTTSTQPTSPSNTPNDTTGTQPNTAPQPGTAAPAPSQGATPMQPVPGGPAPGTGQGYGHDGTHGDGRGRQPSDPGNTNVSPTQNMQGGSAPYTPSQGGAPK